MEILILIVLIALSFLFWFKSRLATVLDIVLKIVFPLLLLLGLSTILFPNLYTAAVDGFLQVTGTLASLQSIDSEFSSLINTPQMLLGSLGELFGEEVVQTETTQSLLGEDFYPDLVDTISGALRTLVLLASTLGMTLLVYLSYTTASFAKVVKLEKRVEELEKIIKKDGAEAPS